MHRSLRIRVRAFAAGISSPATATLPVLSAVQVTASQPQAVKDIAGKLGLPGPYPGRVIEVRNPRMIRAASRTARPIGQTVAAG